MSFENTKCPCGGKKETQTMLCTACIEYIKTTDKKHDLDHYMDQSYPIESRRSMAIRLVTISSRRNKPRTLALEFSAY